MKRLHLTLNAFVITLSLAVHAGAAGLSLNNGNFDNDPSLGGSDDPDVAPTGWFTHYTGPQTWSDFRFGAAGNGAWNNNGITFGQNFLGFNFDPGPEDGFYYTSLGTYSGEISALISGFGYNRVNGNAAGGFDVGLYSSPGFVGADGVNVTGSSTLLGSIFVDISALTGSTPLSQPFALNVNFAGSGIHHGDRIWLRLSDGPDNGDLGNFDEPTIDNLSLTTVVPEPSSLSLLLMAGLVSGLVIRRRR